MKKLLIAISLIALTGAGCTVSTNTDTPPTKTPPASTTAFNASVTFSIGESMTFQDGMKLTLTAINDSRCPSGVQCIWAGELSPVFMFYDVDKSSQEVILGTMRTPSVTVKNYVVTLTSATTEKATITVSKK
ncbi:hypothetical protein K8R04_00515 [Candidatus Uhrbacteria bacterium]|nr:hypothetical protein [Candidatus Uhrbacteria bacterium]